MKEKKKPPFPHFSPRSWPGGCPCRQCGPGGQVKSVLATGSKRDQPMGLAFGAWLGGCLPQFGEPRPWTRDERSGIKVRGLGHLVLILWLRQPEVRVQMWKPKPLSSVVQQRRPEPGDPSY